MQRSTAKTNVIIKVSATQKLENVTASPTTWEKTAKSLRAPITVATDRVFAKTLLVSVIQALKALIAAFRNAQNLVKITDIAWSTKITSQNVFASRVSKESSANLNNAKMTVTTKENVRTQLVSATMAFLETTAVCWNVQITAMGTVLVIPKQELALVLITFTAILVIRKNA